jgi:DNA polymerase III subunit epsilon
MGLFASAPPWDEITYWALDLETGGLASKTDPILAVGMVPIRAGTIRLGEAYATLVRPPRDMAIDPGSVRAHQLVPAELARAPPLAEVLPEVDLRLREGALLVHHRAIDVAFLKRGYARVGLRWPGPRVIDTVDLLVRAAKRARFASPHAPDDLPPLKLPDARAAHGLPEYQAHDALTDAISAAELFLVLRARLGVRTLRDLR